MEKLNILMISGYPPWHPKVGGGDIIAYKLSEAMAKVGHKITFLAVANKKFQKKIDWGNILYVPEKSNFASLSLNDKFDLFHIHNTMGLNFRTYRNLRKNSKCVIGLYAPLAHKIPRSTAEIFYNYICKDANMILSLSDFSRENIADAYMVWPEKIKVMHAGVDEKFFQHQTSSESKDSLVLLFCGRLNGKQQKGMDILLNSMPLILNKHNVVLEIIGDGPRLEQYKMLSKRLCVEGSVRFRGFIPHEHMPEEYSKADLFVFPSRRESFGLVLAEAMAAGLPVVSTKVGAIPEVVDDGKTGLLVPPEDAVKFAEAVNFLLDNPEKMKLMGLSGREKVKEIFTWEKVAQNVVEFYRELV